MKLKDLGDLVMITVMVIVGLLLLVIVAITIFSVTVEARPENKQFSDGQVPKPPLNGNYTGTWIGGGTTTWQGKTLDANASNGINRFADGQRYVFTTSIAKGLHGNQEVLNLNYDQAGNPWWLRLIADELVQTAQGQYLGKVYLKLGPLSFAVTYFSLEPSK